MRNARRRPEGRSQKAHSLAYQIAVVCIQICASHSGVSYAEVIGESIGWRVVVGQLELNEVDRGSPFSTQNVHDFDLIYLITAQVVHSQRSCH